MIGNILRLERSSIHDGPGLRTVVFLQGCSLNCMWCSTPESQYRMPKIGLSVEKCAGCESCVAVCPAGAVKVFDGKAAVDRTLCGLRHCDGVHSEPMCVSVCPNSAFTVYGRVMSAEEVVEEVLKDEIFFFHSGGGVTLSGGEPLEQPEFSAEILRLCRERGVHTALETSLFAQFQAAAHVLPYVDHLFIDLKHLFPQRHRKLTGADNSTILDNICRLKQTGFCGDLVIRVPLIPALNDDDENLRKTVQFSIGLPGLLHLELLPYHRLGIETYRRLGIEYPIPDIRSPDQDYMNERAAFIKAIAPMLTVRVGG